jgi:hypothetical protein
METECWLEVNEVTQNIYQSGMVTVPDMCNGYVAVNKGNTTVQVNQFTLNPPLVAGTSGESVGLQCNRKEIYSGNKGAIQVNVGAGSQPWLSIKWKFYVQSQTKPVN